MPTFSEYPKMLRHPGETSAVLGRAHGEGAPARFPPVTVESADQEEEYCAKGYVGQKGNPTAFHNAHAVKPDSYQPDEYPKWVGDAINGRVVENEDEEIEVLEQLTAATEAPLLPPGPDPLESLDSVRAAFVARAEARGVVVDGRWSLERLIRAATETDGA